MWAVLLWRRGVCGLEGGAGDGVGVGSPGDSLGVVRGQFLATVGGVSEEGLHRLGWSGGMCAGVGVCCVSVEV